MALRPLSDMNDLKFALLQLMKNPGCTAVAVLTLALGITGEATARSCCESWSGENSSPVFARSAWRRRGGVR